MQKILFIFTAMKKITKKLYSYWMKFAHILGEINSRIIFTIIFFVVFGIYALIAKFLYLFKKDSPRTSYWMEKKYREPTIENLTKQF